MTWIRRALILMVVVLMIELMLNKLLAALSAPSVGCDNPALRLFKN